MNAFEKLEVWKQSVQLCADLYIELKGSKEYGFKDQITRAALSIPPILLRVVSTIPEKKNFAIWPTPKLLPANFKRS